MKALPNLYKRIKSIRTCSMKCQEEITLPICITWIVLSDWTPCYRMSAKFSKKELFAVMWDREIMRNSEIFSQLSANNKTFFLLTLSNFFYLDNVLEKRMKVNLNRNLPINTLWDGPMWKKISPLIMTPLLCAVSYKIKLENSKTSQGLFLMFRNVMFYGYPSADAT
jgi:hypothetical protein